MLDKWSKVWYAMKRVEGGCTANLMGVSEREYIAKKEKRLTPVQRIQAAAARKGPAGLPRRSEAAERAALRAEYFKKSSKGRAAALKGQKRLIENA